ncbi:fructokinase [Sphingomonas sp. Leaf33]|uniref:ROK family protein n=1 Tax=Sphingomonas sp. Leaf33 TaxID=1736215 RepID=UPI0006FBA1D3|nr:ROK family protein [Sphingomonas sp. Leaf33]KQN19349.1 fructokinase [Sphingomonas sp. Leaf33]
MIAGLELGGTKCVALLGEGPNRIVERVGVPTTTPEETIGALEAALDGWAFEALGIASFGPIDLTPDTAAYGSIAGTTKPGWSGTALHARFAARYGKPTRIETDVVGAALAEGQWGAAQGMSDHIYITIGTGVGIGAVVGGKPAGGVAHGEAGHMRLKRATGDDFAGWCHFHGDCVEGLVSGPALALRTGIKGADIPGDHPVWDHAAHDIAMLLHNLVVTLAPERIALGGGIPTARPELLPLIRVKLAESLAGYGMFGRYASELDTRLGPPGLGDMAGPLGAIAVGMAA